MAAITINKAEFFNIFGKKLTDEQLEEKLNMLGLSVEEIKPHELVLDVLANRPDLLSQYGIARALSAFLGLKKGIKNYAVNKSNYVVNVERATNDWPYCVTAVVKGLKFDDEKIKEIIQLQEKIGATLLRNRKKGGLGIYPLDKIKFPIKYTSDLPKKIKFRPLEYPAAISGDDILQKHQTGREYSHIVKGWKKFPIFIDAENTVMSMPPIINSNDVGKISEETIDVFIEATGTDFNVISTALNIFVTTLADMGGKVYSTKLVYGKKIFNTPDLASKKFKLDVNYLNKTLGVDLKLSDVKNLLLRMGYDFEKDFVLVPAYRADILHQTDLVEDVAIAYGYNNLKEEIPKVATIAEESRFEIFKKKIANILIGLGLLEVHTYNLTSKDNQVKRMHADLKCVELANALNEDHNVLRSWVTPSMLQILKANKHHEYPQNLFGFGNVFKYDAGKESGVSEATRLCVSICHSSANFTDVKQVLDVLTKALDIKYEIKEVEHGSFIPGRVGRVSVNNTDVAYMGEIHPLVLSEFELEMPVAVLELNLSDLFRLIT